MYKELYYTAPSTSENGPYRLYISNSSSFEFVVPEPFITITGKWVIEGDMVTLNVMLIPGQDHKLCFQLLDNGAQYLPALSDLLPYDIVIPENLFLPMAYAVPLP